MAAPGTACRLASRVNDRPLTHGDALARIERMICTRCVPVSRESEDGIGESDRGHGMTTAVASFAIEGWDEDVYDAPAEGSALARATVRKRFTGDLAGTSVAELQMVKARPDSGEGYIATERVTGTLHGRAGTFVIQHGGFSLGDGEMTQFGHIIHESGTGELTGLRGTGRYQHDANGAVLTLEYELPDR